VRIRGHFSKDTGVREQKRLGNTFVTLARDLPKPILEVTFLVVR
jgi:hypothetical protein